MAQLGEDEFGRPLRFTPAWPPRHEDRSMPRSVPGCSMVFRKSNWPPPSADDVVDASASRESVSNGPTANSNPSSSAGDTDQTGTTQNNASNAVKPKRAVRDYSSFFGKNAAPPSRPVYVLKPGSISVPEAFSGNAEENEQVNN